MFDCSTIKETSRGNPGQADPANGKAIGLAHTHSETANNDKNAPPSGKDIKALAAGGGKGSFSIIPADSERFVLELINKSKADSFNRQYDTGQEEQKAHAVLTEVFLGDGMSRSDALTKASATMAEEAGQAMYKTMEGQSKLI